MKNDPVVILLLGHDKTLLETRQWVLQSRGYRVMTASSLSEIIAIPQAKRVSLLLLCHSLTSSECESATALARSRWPDIRDVLVAAEDMRAPNGILGNLLHTMNGPAKLISIVTEAIRPDTVTPHTRAS